IVHRSCFPTPRSSDLSARVASCGARLSGNSAWPLRLLVGLAGALRLAVLLGPPTSAPLITLCGCASTMSYSSLERALSSRSLIRSEEHTSELQSRENL